MTKKGQGAGGAAGLIAIIGFLIVLYIMFLPSETRQELLENTTGTTTTETSVLNETTLVFEHPGTLDPISNRDREKVLDSFNLYTEKSAVVIKSIDALHIENGWLRRNSYNFSFNIADIANTGNYVVAFDVANSYGRIILTLNGKEIYNAVVGIGNSEPIKIDKDDIKASNSLIISVSDVGLAFWRLNEYDLRNVRVIADFTDVSKKEYKNFFVISATEKENFDKTSLSFVPDCLTKTVGPLQVWINDRELHYSAVPDCGLISKIEFDPNYLKQGENFIKFKAEQGNYFVDRVTIKATLKNLDYQYYYFELEKEDMDKVNDGDANVSLQLKFPDMEDKFAELNINGHLSRLETSNSTYTKNINVFSQEGQNYLKITPKTIMNIVDLKVVLAK